MPEPAASSERRTMPDERRRFFISDAHISGRHDPGEDSVLAFLRQVVTPHGAGADLYLLGDIVEFWFEYAEFVPAFPFRLLAGLRACVDAGVRVFFLPGNRDFAFGRFIRDEVGVQICRDVEEISLGGRRVMLTHGDLLCTQDRSYLLWRRFVRSRLVLGAFHLVPAFLAGAVCRLLVRASQKAVSYKDVDLHANVVDSATERVRQGVDVVVCGHVHRALHRPVLVEGRAGDLYILGPWDEGSFGSYLEWDGRDFHLKRFQPQGE